jgi:hypothetical protein
MNSDFILGMLFGLILSLLVTWGVIYFIERSVRKKRLRTPEGQ